MSRSSKLLGFWVRGQKLSFEKWFAQSIMSKNCNLQKPFTSGRACYLCHRLLYSWLRLAAIRQLLRNVSWQSKTGMQSDTFLIQFIEYRVGHVHIQKWTESAKTMGNINSDKVVGNIGLRLHLQPKALSYVKHDMIWFFFEDFAAKWLDYNDSQSNCY